MRWGLEMAGNPQEQFSSLIGEVYDTALATEPWAKVMRRFTEILGKAGVAIFVRDLKAEEVPREGAEAAARDGPEKYRLVIKVNAPEGTAGDEQAGEATGDDTLGPAIASGEAIILGTFISRDRPTGSLVGIQPAQVGSGVEPCDGATLRLLAPHLRRAFEVHKQFVNLHVQRAATKRVLDHLPVGVLVVDSRGRVLTMNACAESIVAERDGISVDRSGVRAYNSEESTSLVNLIAAAAHSGNGAQERTSGSMVVSRPSLKRSYWVMAAPLPTQGAPEGPSTAVALFISDPDRRHEIPTKALERFFGLTPAETRLVEALVNGKSLEEAAEEFRLSKNTLRTQLNQIFRKTDTSRQAEVVKLMLSTPVQAEALSAQDKHRGRPRAASAGR